MAKRRGNNEGSICKRPDGIWMAQVSVGYDLVTGAPKRKSFYGKTRKEVADKLAKALAEVKNGGFVEPARTTLGEWLDRWLTGYKAGTLKQGTYEGYELLIRVHIKPALGNIPMAKLQANMLQAFYNEKLANGRADGKGGLSTRLVRYLHAVIRQALQQAVKEGLLQRNVADATSPPTIKNKQMRPLTEAELLTFFEAARDDRLFAAFLLAATTGLRRGELLGLCWDCVDLEHGAITVQRQLLSLKAGQVLEETTKSKAGKRSVTLTDDAVRELKLYRKRQLQERLLMGEAFQDNGLVFCKEDGTFLNIQEFTKRFQRWLEKAGLPKVRLHDLRHTHATLLLKRGVPAKLVQERLGHSSITMTLDLYSHVTPEMAKLAAESLNGLLSKRKDPAKAQGG
ncbi:MAG: Transposase [Firmicutes bacterium]|nr:Transposase [candidate division NPL-UPA2 bacterium]